MKRGTVGTHTRRIITAALCVILTAAMTLGGSASAAEALQWALEPTSGYKAISHADGDFWIVVDYADRVGLITSEGKTVVECSEVKEEDPKKYFYCDDHGYCNNDVSANFNIINHKYVSAKKGGKFGLSDSDGNIIIPYEYDSFLVSVNDDETLLIAKMNGKCGVINFQNQIIIPMIYDTMENLGNGIRVSVNGRYGVIDKNERIIIDFVYDAIYRFRPDPYQDFKRSYYQVYLNEFVGLIDTNGKVILPPVYKDFIPDTANTVAASVDGELYGIFDFNGNTILPMQYCFNPCGGPAGDVIENGNIEGFYLIHSSQENLMSDWGVVDTSGRIIAPPEYSDVSILSKDRIIATKYENGAYSDCYCTTVIFNANGQILNSFNYYQSYNKKRDLISGMEFYSDYIIDVKDGKVGITDYSGNTIIPHKYDMLKPCYYENDTHIIAKLDGKYGLLNSIGWEMLPFIYDSISFESATTLKLSTNGYVGIVDIYGNTIVPLVYGNYVYEISPGLFGIEQNEKRGVIDTKGNTIVPAIYVSFSTLSDNLIRTRDSNGNFGLYDYSGNVVLPCIYKDYSYSITVGNKTYYVICNDNKTSNTADVIFDSGNIAIIECKIKPDSVCDCSFNKQDSYTDFGFTDGNSVAILRLYAGAGSVINKVLHTDIMCKIGGKAIRSYNIDGNTAIVAEDLLNYGFGVTWDGDARTLSVTKGSGEAVGMGDIPKDTAEVGSYAMDVYATDITTYVDGKKVKGYNIGGYTIIFVDDLAAFGNVSWNGEAREISFEFAK